MILELSDRYILLYLTNIETVGLYNAGYKLGMLMMLVVMGFNMAWQPYFLKKEKNEREYVANVTTYVLSVLGFLWILILIWTDALVKLQFGEFTFFGGQYWASTQIVSIIALAYIFHALFLLQLPGVYLLERSGLIAWIRGLGAVSNIILNLLFIPEYGIVGAACATCISFILMAVFIFMVNRKLFAIKYEWKKILLITIVAISIWISVHQFPLDNVGKIGFTILYPLIMFSTGILRFNKLKTLLN
jgi:O-antigen/teichoic acid export membrane protein